MTDPQQEAAIVDVWHKNATPWTEAIRENRIESRKLVTNGAIIDAVMSQGPRTALDIGCGEGWLARALAARGVRVIGVDVVPELVERARQFGEPNADFRVASYEMIAAGDLDIPLVDVAIANFSLLGHESVDALIRRVPALVRPGGSFVVQTLHPVVACGDLPYADGWRAGSWTIPGAGFGDPAPWYFRTLETWFSLLSRNGLTLRELREPLHPTSQKPASVIFIAAPG
ncbi:MAG TPA: methyltransferase domain-containing protein [Gemmatimonadaceae bacterium]|nr:methyltransferase domain-containing protein [Gemmatimonadaceae bacterium]